MNINVSKQSTVRIDNIPVLNIYFKNTCNNSTRAQTVNVHHAFTNISRKSCLVGFAVAETVLSLSQAIGAPNDHQLQAAVGRCDGCGTGN